MTDTTAKIRAKGLDATGVTEEIASQMHSNKGGNYMAIVELRVDETHDKADGTHKVDLIITQVEPATDHHLEEHLRELTRTLYYNRGLRDPEQPTLDGAGPERTTEDVLAAGAMHRPHPFLPVDAADDNGICDICGNVQTVGVHSTQELLVDLEDDDEPCPFPGCVLNEHNGDHESADGVFAVDDPITLKHDNDDDEDDQDEDDNTVAGPWAPATANPFTPTGA